MEEQWKNIEGFPYYQVSNFGRVRSLPRRGTIGGILKPMKNRDGYLQVDLCKDGEGFLKKIHRLVGDAFLQNPNNLPQINHRDENKESNFVFINPDGSVDESKSNLEWVTAKENSNHGTRNERIAKTKTNGKLSKAVLQLNLDGTLVREWPSTSEVQRQLGFRHNNISECCLGKRKTSNGFRWKYKKNEEDQK